MLKPKILFSRCFFEPVRYNGGLVIDEFIEKLKNYVDHFYLCPEVEIGLGVPRFPIIITQNDNEKRLIQQETGLDLTDRMISYVENVIKQLNKIDGAVLKAKSPSCGVSSTKLYRGGVVIGKTDGFFAESLKKAFPSLPIEDEGRLRDEKIRTHFLTRVFALCEFKVLSKNPKEAELVKFHTKYKYLLMTYSQKHLKILGKIVADGKTALNEKISKYGEVFAEALINKPTKGKHINTLIHIFGHISKHLNQRERAHFLELIEKYRKNMVKRRVLIEFLRSFAYRFENDYVLMQRYLEPFPEDLSV
ncbi:YbgA family protein [Thermodesulfovibrio yellowstonii]|uniref:DUF1722 domain-containing protein n=1 Tax=Thermodesulfovibrio yellowstonii TaxID=28262 RepID=A0A9W6GGY1_9BACT|nr:DUF523 and DUF1722 domain-containing protein [Thermodesulfovibrio islandicus]GLI53714.1 hypothetical protein TISLANDTSLP1_14070 [Thermodesulfovibrio islandicus]